MWFNTALHLRAANRKIDWAPHTLTHTHQSCVFSCNRFRISREHTVKLVGRVANCWLASSVFAFDCYWVCTAHPVPVHCRHTFTEIQSARLTRKMIERVMCDFCARMNSCESHSEALFVFLRVNGLLFETWTEANVFVFLCFNNTCIHVYCF